ncbi:MAG: hypothetical protein A2275_14585 [Bacteroidetes bacterium RIFOXYA12_FULL_35_11]|nr:MAG: hypothetical protein A2X01_11085 [Bacteroidetes bacterium GWF2_35_48]OFY79996.1 MAG: hypothetical protein A2275_14585 [Bacteroidetes bacterium RIFOXYA12_FULL_35_11]OFY92835.1 MAG: hypothetical protein A2491_07550 [Bacteroidetes bacterium RIFOXYC12_FULL_35_7]HBX51305.1 DUF4294 domain-containing protein [Bacteroidales bacterium]
MKKLFAIFFLGLNILSYAQEKPVAKMGIFTKTIVIEGDTIPLIEIRQVLIFPQFVFKNKRQAAKYDRLIYNVKKVYPFAKLAGAKIREIETNLGYIKTESLRKFYVREEEKKLKADFEEDLKKLTITQGKILIKLIDRETGNTTYQLVKDLRGSFSAFIWQTLARLFGSDLKAEYDPYGDDKKIEMIIQLIENGQL